jgi:mannose-6-phosphate isomerase-like protein (cupin superfamily)
MKVIDHNTQPKEDWRAGVTTQMRISALTGSMQLCIFDQWCTPGLGAPTHLHAVEEVLSVISGRAEIWLDDGKSVVEAGQSVLIPAGHKHGFRNLDETGILHVQATIAAPVFEASYEDRTELSRRYVPLASVNPLGG